MRRILPLIFALLIFLSACTVQEAVSPDLFVSRFAEAFPDYQLESDGAFYENDKCVLFANDGFGNRFAVEMTSDSQGRVQKISLACANADKAENLFSFARDILSVYAPEEDANSVLQSINDGNYFSYYETLWYSYAFSKTGSGLFFSIGNKHYAPVNEPELTLKENESLIF